MASRPVAQRRQAGWALDSSTRIDFLSTTTELFVVGLSFGISRCRLDCGLWPDLLVVDQDWRVVGDPE